MRFASQSIPQALILGLYPEPSLYSHCPNDIAQPTEPTLPPITRLQISWGECGIPRSLKHRRFLEQMAEEVAVREGFQYAKIL